MEDHFMVLKAESGEEAISLLGESEVDLGAFQVRLGETLHKLSRKEAGMLELLHQNLGQAVSRSQFLDQVWGSEQFVSNRTVDTHMLNLRQKIEPDHKNPRFLLTVHGVGYRLVLS